VLPCHDDGDSVQTIRNHAVSCESPAPGPTIVSDHLGYHVLVYSDRPIYQVTVKSERDNRVWGYFYQHEKRAFISSVKPISSYVVWTCPHT
jgi:hypothetical protein